MNYATTPIMATLTGVFGNRSITSCFQKVSHPKMAGISSRRPFPSHIQEQSPFVGAPEFLKQESSQSEPANYSSAGEQKFLLEAMETVKNQNAELLYEMQKLNQRVQH